MKNTTSTLMFFMLYITCFLFACQSTKPSKTDKDKDEDIFSESYYINNANNNLERLRMLLTGLYVQRNENTKKKTIETWTVRDGQDSILAYTLPVGEPAKDGYWLYVHQFISNTPDEPVYSAFQQFKQVSRDSIESIMYKSPIPVTLEDLITKGAACFKDIDYDKLEENGEYLVYVKAGSAMFEGSSKLYKNPRADANNYRKDEYKVMAKRFKFQSSYYEDKIGENFLYKSSVISHLDRIDPTNHALFGKRKKK